MKKKILSLVLVLVMVLCCVPFSAFAAATVVDSGSCGSNVTWKLTSDGTLTISGKGAMTDYTTIQKAEWTEPTTPWVLGNFQNDIKVIVIESGVTHIGDYAFMYCYFAEKAVIPSSVTSIGEYAFSDCQALADVSVPRSITKYSDGVFAGCQSLGGIVSSLMFEGITEIGYEAFSTLFGSYSLTIPSTVTTIGAHAFAGPGLKNLTIGKGVKQIGEAAFASSTLESITVTNGNAYYTVQNGALYNKAMTELVQYPAGKAGSSFAVPSTVKKIFGSAFEWATKLTGITVPNSVTEIGDRAFAYTGLTSIVLPDSLETIGEAEFSGTKLREVYIPRSVQTIKEGAFFGCDDLLYVTIRNPYCAIENKYYPAFGPYGQYGKVTLRGFANSTTQAYAMDCGYRFEALKGFADTDEGTWYFDPVLWAVEKGITNGASEFEFNPTGNCLRAQVVTFLWRAAGKPEPTTTANPFVDVKETDFYYKPVLWAVEKGITSGVDATHFGPFAECNRAQVVTFLYRAAGSPKVSGTNPFADVAAGSFYEAPVLWAVKNGITNGVDATHFGSLSTCNRAQVVTFLYRMYG